VDNTNTNPRGPTNHAHNWNSNLRFDPCFLLLNRKRAAVSNQTAGLLVQPFAGWRLLSQIQLGFIGFVASSANMRFSS
jgi:hypothetical protein